MPAKLIVSLKAICEGHQQSVYSLCSDRDFGFFSAGSDGKIVHWTKDNLEQGQLWAQLPEAIFSVSYSEDQIIYAGGKSGKLYILKKGFSPRIVQLHEKSIFGILAVHEECQYSIGGDGWIRKIDFYQRVVQEVQLSEQSLRTIFPYGEGFLIGGSEGKLWILDQDFNVVSEIKAHGNSVFTLAIMDNTLFSAGRDAKIKVWDNRFKLIQSIDAHWYTIHGLAVNPNRKYMVSGSMDKTIRVWNAQNYKLLKVIESPKFEAHKSSVNALLWLDNTTFISCSDDTQIKCWKIDDSLI